MPHAHRVRWSDQESWPAIIPDIPCFFVLGTKYSLLVIFEVSSLLLLVIATYYARFYSAPLFYFYQHYDV